MTWAAFDDDTSCPADYPAVQQSASKTSDPTASSSQEAASSNGLGETVGCQGPTDSCCSRWITELSQRPHFETKDPATGRVLDIPESFAPRATFLTVFWKLVFSALSIAWIAAGFLLEISGQHSAFYLAYPESWCFVFCALYSICSVFNTLWAWRTPQPTDKVGWRIAATWITCEISLHSVILMTIVQYASRIAGENDDVDDDCNSNLIALPVLVLMVFIDAFFVNQVPFRWTHWIFYVLPVETTWVAWSLVHALILDLDQDSSDMLIDQVNWESKQIESAIYCIVVLIGLGPCIFAMLWWVSIYQVPCCSCLNGAGMFNWKDKRNYTDSFLDHPDTRPTVEDVEEGSIFARWTR